MRLWTLHPKYLDPQGLVALWREALLANAVLRGATRGYKNHPQLDRFKPHVDPCGAINAYLAVILAESVSRGYSFDASKVDPVDEVALIATTSGQLEFEWRHLTAKLSVRSPAVHSRWSKTATPGTHPLFRIVPGEIEPWERG